MKVSKTLIKIAEKLNAEIVPITYKGYGMKVQGFDLVKPTRKGKMILVSFEPKSKYLLINCYSDNGFKQFNPKRINEKTIPQKIVNFVKDTSETHRYI